MILNEQKKSVRYIILFIIPVVLLSAFLYMLIPFYSQSSNIVQRGSVGDHPLIAPIGIGDVKVEFVKESVQDAQCTIKIDSTAFCNQTPFITLAYCQKDFNKYAIIPVNMQVSGTALNGFSTPYSKASYFAWQESMGITFALDKCNQYAFPFDVYETPNLIIGFSTQETNASNKFYFESWELSTQIPVGFSASMRDIRQLSNDEMLIELGNNIPQNENAISFKIIMIRDNASLILLSIYSFIPLLGIWSIFAITEFLITKVKERVSIFAGALLATFAYLFTIRSFMPPTVTLIEITIIMVIGAWSVIELSRAYKQISKTQKTSQTV